MMYRPVLCLWRQALRAQHRSPATAGLTLVELIMASALTSVVLGIAFTGVVSAINASRLAELRTNRRIDLSRAFDFISNEIRMASRINHSAIASTNGSSVTVANVAASSGLNLSDLGSYGTVVLYLEIPIADTGISTCSDGSAPASVDRVVYDIRPSDSEWIPPLSIHRYGRIPELNGTVDPCGKPSSSDTLVDAISQQASTQPTCEAPGQLVGASGFQACVNGAQVDLFLESAIAGVESRVLNSTASSRLGNVANLAGHSAGGSGTLPSLVLTKDRFGDEIEFSWTWSGTSGTTFQLQEIVNGRSTKIYSGTDFGTTITLPNSSEVKPCYVLTTDTQTNASLTSNKVCDSEFGISEEEAR